MLTREGWRPYDAEPDRSVYERLGCPIFCADDANHSGLCATTFFAASAVRITAP